MRVEVREADGTVFTDIITPSTRRRRPAPKADPERPAQQVIPELVVLHGEGFVPGEDVAVAVVIAHGDAAPDGTMRPVPMLDALEPVLERLTADKQPDAPLLRGPRGGVLTTATVRDATHWDDLVKSLGFANLTRHGLRHTGATWKADAGIALHVLQEILGHQSIETNKGHLHPDHRHLAEAARQANQFLSAPPARKDASRRDRPRL